MQADAPGLSLALPLQPPPDALRDGHMSNGDWTGEENPGEGGTTGRIGMIKGWLLVVMKNGRLHETPAAADFMEVFADDLVFADVLYALYRRISPKRVQL